MVGSSLTTLLSLPLQAFPSDGWVSVRLSARRFMPINLIPVFLGQPQPRPPLRLSFEFLDFRQPTICSTWPCYLIQRVQSNFARSSGHILSNRFSELTWSFVVVTLHIQRIIARSLRCRRCKSDKVGVQICKHGAWHSWHTNCKSILWRWWETVKMIWTIKWMSCETRFSAIWVQDEFWGTQLVEILPHIR